MIFQRTLKSSVSLKGIGLHSGAEAQMTLHPAAANRGIHFVRTDLENSAPISAHYKNVVNTQLATTLGRGNVTISTVEHVLAALQGMGVDNALIEVSGPEVPLMDGSSAPFAEAIQKVGTEVQMQTRPYLALRRRVEVKLAEK
ncbi:MAG: UDP-3-O-acyl-N-acetylglucosamine deacetylase [Methylotenera sp.]|nr:UDP-3-O-acyl-N-acetylglucosamine deacetylase [Oligoflexia bacterium]